MAMNLKSKVKFPVLGGTVYATIISTHENAFEFNGQTITASKETAYAVVETPTGQKEVKPVSALAEVSETDFANAIAEVIKTLSSIIGKKDESAMSKELETVKAEVDALKTSVATLTSEKEALATKNKELEASLATASTENGTLKAQVEKTAKLAKGQERLSAMKAVEATEGDEAKAAEEYADMTDKEFAGVLKTATSAFKKLTDIRKTSLPATTEQTQSKETKLTQAADKAVAEAKVEEVAVDPAIATTGKSDEVLQSAIAKVMNHGRKTKK